MKGITYCWYCAPDVRRKRKAEKQKFIEALLYVANRVSDLSKLRIACEPEELHNVSNRICIR